MSKIIKLLKLQRKTAFRGALQFEQGTPGRLSLTSEALALDSVIILLTNKKARKEILKAWGVTK